MVKKILLIVLATAISMVMLAGCSSSKDDKSDNSRQSQVVTYEEIDGAALIKEAQDNAAAANHKYKGKNVRITNVQVSSIDSDGDYINLDTQNSKMTLMSIRCSIDKKDKALQDQVYAVKNGQKVIVQGCINEIGDVLGVSLRLDKIEPADGRGSKQVSSTASSLSIGEYVSKKDKFDVEIAAVAADINNYLSWHSDFRGSDAQSLIDRAKSTLDKVENTQKELQQWQVNSGDEAVKTALIRVLDCEAGRIRGLYKGMLDSKNNGDYMSGFRDGTAASYRFDDENAKLNALYKR